METWKCFNNDFRPGVRLLMHHSRTTITLPLVIFAVIRWTCANDCCIAQKPPAAVGHDAERVQKQDHGLPEILSQQLFRDRQIEPLLRSAEAANDSRDLERFRECLLAIFSQPYDLFEFDVRNELASSLRRRALKLLLLSSPELQRAWIESNRVIADHELESAIRRGGRHAVAQVARRFPLTGAGIQAEVINLTCELLKGDRQTFDVRIQQLEEMYAGTVLDPELGTQLRSLKKIAATATPHDQFSNSTRLSIPATQAAGSLSPPWPIPLWTWHEAIHNFPGTPRPETRNILSGLDSEATYRLNNFSNWKTVFWHDNIVIRTPFRIVALDRASGKEQWSVPTDTFTPELISTYDDLEDAIRRSSLRQHSMDMASPICGMAEFGLMSIDSDFLFFVDRFEFLTEKDPFADNPTGRVIRNRNGFPFIEENDDPSRKSVASRLVAVSRRTDSAIPAVAWQIGDGDSFEYHPVTKIESTDSRAKSETPSDLQLSIKMPAVEGERIESVDEPWSRHRFLSPPCGSGTRLYVLTLNETQVFLNCLFRNTGQLLWRQPLAYTDENAVSLIDKFTFTQRTSVCLVGKDTVVCSLADGMVIGVNAVDGSLKWATAIRDVASVAPQFRFGRAFPDYGGDTSISSPSILVPSISDDIIICCNHHSVSVHGLSLRTGEILWKSSRRAFGAGEVGGSPDHYVAGISQQQVILIGDRHCRSLNLKTGEQNWVVEIHGSSGRAECRGDRCIIPLRYGRAMAVNLATGSLIPESILEAPENSRDPYGAIASDDELICVSTPISVTVFPQVDMLLKKADELPALTADPARHVMVRAQALLINGDFEKSLAVLCDAVGAKLPREASAPHLDEALAQLVLEKWGHVIQRDREARNVAAQKSARLPADGVPAEVELLSKLKLPSDVEFRAAIFQRLSEPTGSPESSLTIDDIKKQRGWKSLMRLTKQWSVRPDLLFDSTEDDRRLDPELLHELSVLELRQLASDFLQHPETIPEAAAFRRFVAHLLSRSEFAVAELCLIRWCEISQSANKEPDVSATELLAEMRSTAVPPIPQSRDTGLTSSVTEPLAFELLPFIRKPDADFEGWYRQVRLDSLPKRCRTHAYMAGEAPLTGDLGANTKLLTIDPMDGTVRDEVPLPFPIDQHTGKFFPLSDNDLTPGLFPVCGAGEIAMIACPVPGQGSVLWQRRFQFGKSDASRVEFGSLGSDHLIWQHADTLHCSDPLTGEDLWTRELTLSQSEETLLHRGVSPSVRRIAGDRQITLVTGSDSQSYERFDTRDGRRLSVGRLNRDSTESVVTVGRCLLYTDSNGRLHLFDGGSEKEELTDVAPIFPLRRDHRIVCQILENHRVLVVSESPELLELVMIDVEHGIVLFRTPVSQYISEGFVFSFSAFERNGRLFAALSGAGRSERSIQQAFMRGVPQLSDGPLLCLNPATGELQWSVQIDQAIFPDIHGDPTDLLIGLSAPKLLLEGNLRTRSADTVIVQVFDETTGQLIAQSPSFSSLPPLRCVHIADERLIQLTTANAIISVRAPTMKSDNLR